MFEIGDKVSYPMHGAGVIENIEEKLILDDIRKYYALRFADGVMKVLIPVETAMNIGLRSIIEPDHAKKVLDLIYTGECPKDNSNWNKRLRENQDKLKTGDIFEVASVVKGLKFRMSDKGLSSGEKRMMNQSLQILVSELSLSLDQDPIALKEQIIQAKIG